MKKIVVLGLALFFANFASATGDPQPLTCPRFEKISENIEAFTANWCENPEFIKKNIDTVIKEEIKDFETATIQRIFFDNTNNTNYLAEKGVYDLKLHRICLQTICQKMWEKCNFNKSFWVNYQETKWCEKLTENQFAVAKIKLSTALKNQGNRKNRVSVREKLRATEGRNQTYFLGNLINFFREFKTFTCKITSFVRNPLSQ